MLACFKDLGLILKGFRVCSVRWAFVGVILRQHVSMSEQVSVTWALSPLHARQGHSSSSLTGRVCAPWLTHGVPHTWAESPVSEPSQAGSGWWFVMLPNKAFAAA